MTTLPARFKKLTYEDYCAFPDDGKQHELIDGVHYVTPAPLTRHQRIAGNLHHLFWPVLEQGLGEVFFAPVDVLLSKVDVVQPDLLFVSADRKEIIANANIQGAPDLVVEILSQSTKQKDLVVKLELYERAGVEEYWIVDPLAEMVTVYQLRDGRYEKPQEFPPLSKELVLDLPKNVTVVTTPLLPGFSFPLSEIFF